MVVLGVAQRSRLRVDGVFLTADIGVAQNSQPLGVCGHQTVFDTVVNHLDEMTGAVWTAVQVALFGCAVDLFKSRGPRNVAAARGQRFED